LPGNITSWLESFPDADEAIMPEFLRFLVMLATAAAAATSDMDMGPYLLTHPNPNLTVLLDTQYKSR